MKRKPNKPRPEAQTHTEPVNGAAEPEGSAFGAGSEQESGAAGTCLLYTSDAADEL